MTQMQTTWRDVDVSAYVDGELDPAKQAAFETALAQDRALRRKVERMREVVTLVRAAPLRESPRNYLLTPAMVAERSPQPAQRRSRPLLFMRLATSLAAIVFVATAGMTYVQRGIAPGMLSQAPKAADEIPALEAQRAVVAIVEVSEEAEVMLAHEPEEIPVAEPEAMAVPAANAEAEMQTEKALEAELPVAALAPAPPETTPQPGAEGGGTDAAMNVQEQEEALPQSEDMALEAAPAAEGQVMDKAEQPGDDNTAALSGTGEGERPAYDTGETSVELYDEPATIERRQTPAWWLPAVLGAVTLLLAGITFWMSRGR